MLPFPDILCEKCVLAVTKPLVYVEKISKVAEKHGVFD